MKPGDKFPLEQLSMKPLGEGGISILDVTGDQDFLFCHSTDSEEPVIWNHTNMLTPETSTWCQWWANGEIYLPGMCGSWPKLSPALPSAGTILLPTQASHALCLCTYILAKMQHSWKHQKNKKFLLAENSKEIFVVCLFPTKEFLEVQKLP